MNDELLKDICRILPCYYLDDKGFNLIQFTMLYVECYLSAIKISSILDNLVSRKNVKRNFFDYVLGGKKLTKQMKFYKKNQGVFSRTTFSEKNPS